MSSMEIHYRDFAPDWKHKVLGLAIGGRQNMDAVLKTANDWFASRSIVPISVETLILPESAAEDTASSGHDDTRYNVGMFELSSQRVQVIRVWYRE